MKIINTLLITLMIASIVGCSTRQSADKDLETRREALLESIEAFNTAFRSGDIEKLASMITENYQHTNGSSKVIGKESWLAYLQKRSADLASGNLKVVNYEMDQMNITFHDDMAVVTARVLASNRSKDELRENAYRVTNIWVYQEGKWKRAAFHDGRISE